MSPLTTPGSIAALRGIMRRKAAAERCELCGAEVSPEHRHLVEPSSRKLMCACQACTILFNHRSTKLKYRSVPRDVRPLPHFQMSDAEWAALMLPIDIAFFMNSSPLGRVVAFYPSPAGPTESLLSLGSWNDIVERNPDLKGMEPDVEALLVNRKDSHREYFIAPIDKCYHLVGLIRTHWRGLSGGDQVWNAIDGFFNGLRPKMAEAADA